MLLHPTPNATMEVAIPMAAQFTSPLTHGQTPQGSPRKKNPHRSNQRFARCNPGLYSLNSYQSKTSSKPKSCPNDGNSLALAFHPSFSVTASVIPMTTTKATEIAILFSLRKP
ncbi:hypothetical protein Acr_29g0008320 [Actinidia rufa]|uniref:Uncharacterized protein n=1 Tax=Actinidia rufa TaxID=165716 RepID=A0A7J0HEW5_9ERIC|nr:hypothetical protein Acr_29g0008320 [Actinidia rufa]